MGTRKVTSPFAAIAGLQSKTQRSVFYGQIKAILIGKELAEKGLKKGIYPLNRYAKVPPQAFLLLTKDKAYEVLDLSLWDNRIPASALVDFFHAQEKGDQAFSQQIWEFSRNINSRTQDGFLPLLAYDQEDKAFIINGLGVFHQDRLVGELSGEEARMFGLVSGRSQNAHLHLSVPGFGSLTYRKIRARPRISLRKNAMKPVFTIDLKVQGYLAESTEGEIKLTKEDTRIIDREVSKYLHREMVKTLQNIQALNSDL